mmetsp:Transcript_109763/g.321344  ORF Transcript_109763/g.321344 Transcript_109763/m.321344 type:complete len:211 (+) Transcript_109763:866-1498(+)
MARPLRTLRGADARIGGRRPLGRHVPLLLPHCKHLLGIDAATVTHEALHQPHSHLAVVRVAAEQLVIPPAGAVRLHVPLFRLDADVGADPVRVLHLDPVPERIADRVPDEQLRDGAALREQLAALHFGSRRDRESRHLFAWGSTSRLRGFSDTPACHLGHRCGLEVCGHSGIEGQDAGRWPLLGNPLVELLESCLGRSCSGGSRLGFLRG